ncbi:CAI-1 autoinducer sensor kinase/phosphatase CqsS [Elysia marginata]|uniref:CAI-1 autoinducer sensor kinase/phosphatase CqsS n=1 Tax=Elysia marginata TaxID=1093978 RepID=A0AAV4JDZ2_9GAST|nr:CAI-1 autoinducer sensor kinase/phosphatase CqsS [Elysia marginata]
MSSQMLHTLATIVANTPIINTIYVAHIETYNPTIAHYRSAHAPNRRYLPSDVTVHSMYNDFKDKSNTDMCYSSFYKIFKTMNVSMVVLGHEECEICEAHDMHKKNCDCKE